MTHYRHETPEAYAREVRRHLPPMPRRVRRAVEGAVERHLAERLVEGRPAWLTIARLGPAERVAAAVTEAWLEALDAGRTGADHLRLAVRGALVPAGVATAVLGGLMVASQLWQWHGFPLQTGWLVPWLAVLALPVIAACIAPLVAFYLGAGAMQALARETSPATRRRLAPRVAGALALGGMLGAGAGFFVQDAVLPAANRASVDAIVAGLGAETGSPRSPTELGFGELRARLRDREAGRLPPDRTARGIVLTPGEAALKDWNALGVKVALPAAIATGTWSGLAWGAAFGLSRIPAFASGGLALGAGYLLAGLLAVGFGVPQGWALIAGTMFPLVLALPWLFRRPRA